MATSKVAASTFSAQPPSSSISASGTFKRRELDLRQVSQSFDRERPSAEKFNLLHCEKPQIPVSVALMKRANFRPFRGCEAALYEFTSPSSSSALQEERAGKAS